MKLIIPISLIVYALTLQANDYPLVQPISVEKAPIKTSKIIQKELTVLEKEVQKKPEVKSAQQHTNTMVLELKFQANSADFKENATQELEEFSNYLLKNKSYQVVIYGYTDSSGEKEANRILSQKRANSVIKVLQNSGISSTRLTAIGMGAKNPIADNTTAQGRATNRRIEALIIE
jgi:OOP family OmpA-OmpF porin